MWRKSKPVREAIYVGATMDGSGGLRQTTIVTDALVVSYVPDYGNVCLMIEVSRDHYKHNGTQS